MDTTDATTRSFQYYLSADVELNVRVRIVSLDGNALPIPMNMLLSDPFLQHLNGDGRFHDMFITAQLWADGHACTLPVRTSHHAFTTKWMWGEWLTLPLKYSELPRSAQLALTVWGAYRPRQPVPIGGTTVHLFGKHGTLRKGRHWLYLWSDREADGSICTSTPGKTGSRGQVECFNKVLKRFEREEVARIEWLDPMAFREVERAHLKEVHRAKHLTLNVDFPTFDHPVVYQQRDSAVGTAPSLEFENTAGVVSSAANNLSIAPIDAEIGLENLVERKHHELTRSERRGPLDRDLKPNFRVRDELARILRYPPTHPLSLDEQDLLWKFRFYLTREKKGLTKFLKCVNWTDAHEARLATELIEHWEAIDVDDALELLSVSFTNPSVRQYAVSRLEKADDDDLILYLLQLVQALKYEPAAQQQDRVLQDQLQIEINDAVAAEFPRTGASCDGNEQGLLPSRSSVVNVNESSLANFLVSRGIANPVFGNYLHWYLLVECEDKRLGTLYRRIHDKFAKAVEQAPECANMRDSLYRQGELLSNLCSIGRELKAHKDSRPKKIERMRNIINTGISGTVNGEKSTSEVLITSSILAHFKPMALPLDPTVNVVGINASSATIFKSALNPMLLPFRVEDSQEYMTIFKVGDDLRQDQLIIQIILLMERLLRKENLDLKLTPYKVLATGADHGFVQYIKASAVANVLSDHTTILNYFRKSHPAPDAPYGVSPEIMDTYIKSCAGYCVITYLLGIGDRHLDNLLLSDSGHLFHIDFGYILGRDPKPLPPPMKLCKEMVEAMGGQNSAAYKKFTAHCFEAFLILRKKANLILNLFTLMLDANVPDIALEPDKAVMKVQENFRLDLSEEEAIHFFQSLINESVSALFAQFVENLHKWAQYWRS